MDHGPASFGLLEREAHCMIGKLKPAEIEFKKDITVRITITCSATPCKSVARLYTAFSLTVPVADVTYKGTC